MRKLFSFIIICFLIPWITYSQERFKVEDALTMMSKGYITESIQLLEKLTNLNEVYASLFLGQCYAKGLGVSVDEARAFKMFRRAAEKGLPEAQVMLARCYASGSGCEINIDRSQYWQKKSEDVCDPVVLEMIEDAYFEGIKAQKTLNSLAVSENDASSNALERKNDRLVNNRVSSSNGNLDESAHMSRPVQLLSDVDMKIPNNPLLPDSTFAVII